MQRGAFMGRRAPGPFHCLVCKQYVTGTESGHCPRCGFVPPTTVSVIEPQERPSRAPWGALLVAATIAACALLAVGSGSS